VGKRFIVIGCILGFLTVALGAFGAHAIRSRIAPDDFATYQTAIQYLGLHTFAVIVAGLLCWIRPELKSPRMAGWLFLIGTLIFSGSLIALALTGVKWLGAITPIGGACFLAGWISLTVAAASLPEYRSS
jgi:uncharacterized membrane protein YgdD (TMEM256/DUF423 family)